MTHLIIGIFLLLLGLELIGKAVLGLDIPVFRIGLGILLVYWGFSVITGMNMKKTYKKFACWSGKKSYCHSDSDSAYNIVFGHQTIDLNQVKTTPGTRIDASIVFGSSVIYLPKNISTKIIINTVFGSATLPDKSIISSGTHTYYSHKDQDPVITVDVNIVFGSAEIIYS